MRNLRHWLMLISPRRRRSTRPTTGAVKLLRSGKTSRSVARYAKRYAPNRRILCYSFKNMDPINLYKATPK